MSRRFVVPARGDFGFPGARTYQSRQSGYSTNPKLRMRIRIKGRYSGPLVPLFDDQFERGLPPEIRAELGASPRSTNQPPVRIPETEAEIEQALEWLKSQGYLRPTVPAPPPVLPPREVAIPTVSKRAGAAPPPRHRNVVASGGAHRIATLARPALRQHATSSPVGRSSSGAAGAGRSPQSVAGGSARSSRFCSLHCFDCGVAAGKNARQHNCAGFLPGRVAK
jgi:hypothetical protein